MPVKSLRSVYDIAILGAGILGTTTAYWLSLLYPRLKIIVLEQADAPARHTSARNTGVIHRPFYLHPEKKKIFAHVAQLSYPSWKSYAAAKKLPWNPVGTIEVALNARDEEAIAQYAVWAKENGMEPQEYEILQQSDLSRIEPRIRGTLAFFSKTDTSVDFGLMTRSLAGHAAQQGVEFRYDTKIRILEETSSDIVITPAEGETLQARYLINCAGGGSLYLAKYMGLGTTYADINFRGEYWVVDPQATRLATHNIYTVPTHREFPFLDPHWIIRANGQCEVGPTAVPVLGAYAYRGIASDFKSGLRKLFEPPMTNKLNIFMNPEFLKLAWTEWRSTVSRKAMVDRIRMFLPDLEERHLIRPGIAGIRSSVIDEDGVFVKEALEFYTYRSFHVVNYNSPGATGAPAYAVHIISHLIHKDILPEPSQAIVSPLGNFSDIQRALPKV